MVTVCQLLHESAHFESTKLVLESPDAPVSHVMPVEGTNFGQQSLEQGTLFWRQFFLELFQQVIGAGFTLTRRAGLERDEISNLGKKIDVVADKVVWSKKSGVAIAGAERHGAYRSTLHSSQKIVGRNRRRISRCGFNRFFLDLSEAGFTFGGCDHQAV